ncbi:MAG: hypothetical protein E5V51_00115 [Mesorhizobium sp.]|nr:hypothetical protein EOA35_12970 [Mesorhizobium sp. M8A.F.Ca.ET.023.01.1.1]TIW90609.1 MAG: hypothetical protein E5V51_00115 [Mesorhizobium sp.]
MPFNADTYRAKKYAASAWENLGRAREIKARIEAGLPLYDWEASRLPMFVRLARIDMHLSLSHRRMRELNRRR